MNVVLDFLGREITVDFRKVLQHAQGCSNRLRIAPQHPWLRRHVELLATRVIHRTHFANPEADARSEGDFPRLVTAHRADRVAGPKLQTIDFNSRRAAAVS